MTRCKSCDSNAYYFDKDKPEEKFCSKHKTDGMTDSRHCEHGRQKTKCKECGGGSICEHNHIKSICKECGGASICEHKRIKRCCKECGGSAICEHNRIKSRCKECCGSAICEHNIIKYNCVICRPDLACANCKYIHVPTRYRFHPYCFNCYCTLNPDLEIPRRYKVKEQHLRDALREEFPNIAMRFDKMVDGGCSRNRPDILIDDGFPIIIECDENRHNSYSCENKRMMELFEDLGSRPIRVIRFNPDGYKDESGVRHTSCFNPTKNGLSIVKKEWIPRISILSSILRTEIGKVPEKEIDVMYLFY